MTWRFEKALEEISFATDFCIIAALPLLIFQTLLCPGDILGCIKAAPAQLEDTVTLGKYLQFLPHCSLYYSRKGQHGRDGLVT